MIRRLSLVVRVATFAGVMLAGGASAQTDPGLRRLEQEMARLEKLSGGRMGVGVIHLETGRQAYLNGAEPFPMASTYKVPIAVQLLSRVQRGEVSLTQMEEVEPWDLHPGSGTISDLLDDPGVVLSLHNLLEMMLLISDNSATDIVLEAAGGGAAVTARMRSLGIDGIRVDRPTVNLIADWVGIEPLPPPSQWSPAKFRELFEAVDEGDREAAAAAFDRDPRDTATPEGMAKLLAGVWRREFLDEAHSALLLDIMLRCETGENRLRGLLPPGTEVYHKTGTIGGTTNDVGIITLPNGAGHVVTVAFVKESTIDVSERERAIAHVARAVHDYFTFAPGM